MNINVGTIDKLIRIIIGLGIITAGIALKSFLGLIGLIPLATGLSGRCPLYLPFGISTCNKNEEGEN